MGECKFCGDPSFRETIMLPICKMKSGFLYLLKDQMLPGRCILAFNRHIRELSALPLDDYYAFMTDAYYVAQSINKIFQPNKINYLVFGDESDHLHLHIVPKYRDKVEWGKIFTLDRIVPLALTNEEYEKMIAKLKNTLCEV